MVGSGRAVLACVVLILDTDEEAGFHRSGFGHMPRPRGSIDCCFRIDLCRSDHRRIFADRFLPAGHGVLLLLVQRRGLPRGAARNPQAAMALG